MKGLIARVVTFVVVMGPLLLGFQVPLVVLGFFVSGMGRTPGQYGALAVAALGGTLLAVATLHAVFPPRHGTEVFGGILLTAIWAPVPAGLTLLVAWNLSAVEAWGRPAGT